MKTDDYKNLEEARYNLELICDEYEHCCLCPLHVENKDCALILVLRKIFEYKKEKENVD